MNACNQIQTNDLVSVVMYLTLLCFCLFPSRFVPSFLRLGSWNVVMFVSFEQLKRAMMASKKKMEVTM